MGQNRAFLNPTPEQLAAANAVDKLVRFIKAMYKKDGKAKVEAYIDYFKTNPAISLPEGVEMDREQAVLICRSALTEAAAPFSPEAFHKAIDDKVEF